MNNTHGVNLFYWFFESRGTPDKDPLVVWLTGGPGCSSMLALLVENGPFLIPEGKTEPELNKYGKQAIFSLSLLYCKAKAVLVYMCVKCGCECVCRICC